MAEGALWGRLILVIEDELALALELEAALLRADADVIVTDQARGAILVERPFLSAVVLDCEPASRERRAIVRRLRERDLPFLFYGARPPDAVTSDGAPFISNTAPTEDVVRALALLISVQRPS